MYISNQLPVYRNVYYPFKKKDSLPVFTGGPRVNMKYAQFDLQMQDTMSAISTKMKSIKKFFDNSSYIKSTKVKDDYKDLVTSKKSKGYTFMVKEGPDKGKSLTIVQTAKNADITRLVFTDSMNNQEHILIEGIDKAIANVFPSNPYIIPPNRRYMTSQDLADNRIKERIELACDKLVKFDEYLSKIDNTRDDDLEEVKEKKASKVYTPRKKLLAIFDMDKEALPEHLKIKHVSSSSGKMLSFALDTSDGGQLEVSKKANYTNNYQYILMEKTSPKGEKTFLAVEPETKMFLKTNTLSGKPTLFRGELLFYSTKDAKDLGLNDRFSQYMNEIFKVEAVSAVEDPQPRVRKPKAEQVEVATEPKRLGRKPKEKQEPIQAKDNTVVDKSEKEVQQVNDVLIEEVVAPVVEKIEEKPAEKVVQVIEENISIEEEIIPPQAPKPLSIDDALPNITLNINVTTVAAASAIKSDTPQGRSSILYTAMPTTIAIM